MRSRTPVSGYARRSDCADVLRKVRRAVDTDAMWSTPERCSPDHASRQASRPQTSMAPVTGAHRRGLSRSGETMGGNCVQLAEDLRAAQGDGGRPGRLGANDRGAAKSDAGVTSKASAIRASV